MENTPIRGAAAAEFSRREFVRRAGVLGTGALIASAIPVAARIVVPESALAQGPATDATLQAFFDTIIPGRPATTTDLGHVIHPGAIAGVDAEAGGVEADALLLSHNQRIGFDTLAPAFLADLEARAVPEGGPFLTLDYESRERVVVAGLSFSNGTRLLWEAATAIPFTAFCAAATQRSPNWKTASGLRVMGHPGTAFRGYRNFSWRRKLARGRTKTGNLP